MLFIFAGGRWRALNGAGLVSGWRRRRARLVRQWHGRLLPVPCPFPCLSRSLAARKGPPLPLARRPQSLKRDEIKHHNKRDVCTNTESVPTRAQAAPRTASPEAPVPSSAADRNDIAAFSIKALIHQNDSQQHGDKDSGKSLPTEVQGPQRQPDPQGLQDTQKSQGAIKLEHSKRILIISEHTIDLLREYIIRNDTNIDLYKFDSDHDYKMLVLYRLNPYVRLEHCRQLERLERPERGAGSQLSFVRLLGLWPVGGPHAEQAAQHRRRLAKRPLRSIPIKLISSDSDFEEPTKRSIGTHSQWAPAEGAGRQLRRSGGHRAGGEGGAGVDGRPLRLRVEGHGSLGSEFSKRSPERKRQRERERDSDAENERPRARAALLPKRSSVPPGREYSPLEDHSIVSWVSGGTGRDRRVNGNQLWRELETCYRGITGVTRTWHSLRNRYLRYILPALHRLALPAAQRATLRAAAATGRTAKRKRRNSLFAPGPAMRSAFSRRGGGAGGGGGGGSESEGPGVGGGVQDASPTRALRSSVRRPSSPAPPRAPRSPSPSPPTPRYSMVTRRYALSPQSPHNKRQPHSKPSSPREQANDKGSTHSPLQGPRLRRRRQLYNPAALT